MIRKLKLKLLRSSSSRWFLSIFFLSFFLRLLLRARSFEVNFSIEISQHYRYDSIQATQQFSQFRLLASSSAFHFILCCKSKSIRCCFFFVTVHCCAAAVARIVNNATYLRDIKKQQQNSGMAAKKSSSDGIEMKSISTLKLSRSRKIFSFSFYVCASFSASHLMYKYISKQSTNERSKLTTESDAFREMQRLHQINWS